MSGIENALFDVGRLDRLARQKTAVHRIDPRAKVITAAVFLLCVVSFGKYEVASLLPFAVFPIALAATGRTPFGYVGKRILAVAPFGVMVGIFNPFLDREILVQWGPVGISGGWVSFASILVRLALTIGTALVLIAVTSFDGLCLGLRRLGVPRVFTVQLLLLYRYIFILAEEALRLVRARAMRSFGRRGMGMKVYASLLGHLLLRTLDRAGRIHLAMCCRGFDGEIRSSRQLRFGWNDAAFTAAWCAVFVALRFWNLPQLLGEFVTELVR